MLFRILTQFYHFLHRLFVNLIAKSIQHILLKKTTDKNSELDSLKIEIFAPQVAWLIQRIQVVCLLLIPFSALGNWDKSVPTDVHIKRHVFYEELNLGYYKSQCAEKKMSEISASKIYRIEWEVSGHWLVSIFSALLLGLGLGFGAESLVKYIRKKFHLCFAKVWPHNWKREIWEICRAEERPLWLHGPRTISISELMSSS